MSRNKYYFLKNKVPILLELKIIKKETILENWHYSKTCLDKQALFAL